MSWHCSRVLVEEFLAVTCSDGAQSAPSSTTPTPDQYYWPDKTTEHSQLSRFGMTCELLMESRGEELLTWFRAGFLVKTSVQQEEEQVLKVTEVDSGQRWQGSFVKYSPDSSSWKTAQCSLLGDSELFSETWPQWGSMRNGACYLRQIAVPLICDNESGSWATPTASMDKKARGNPLKNAQDTMKRGFSLSLPEQVAMRQFQDGVTENGQLNPEWVEWLMGWTIGHTGLKPLEMGKFQEWLQQHGGF